MPKVRWTVRCAGGCGRWLTIGQRAVRLHRRLWCPDCATSHLLTCQAAPMKKDPERVEDRLQPALW